MWLRRYAECGYRKGMGARNSARSACRRLASTTLGCSELSELVKITHPYHPLRGNSYPLIKSKKWEQRDLLSLLVPGRGTICVPRDWTDRADPDPYEGQRAGLLSYERLVELRELVSTLKPGLPRKKKS